MKKLMMILGAAMLLASSAIGDDFFSGMYVADKARTLQGGVFTADDIHGIVSLKIGKANAKGIFKISGTLTTLDGKKHAIKAGKLTLASDGVTYSGLTVKNYGAMTLRLWGNGFNGYLANGWMIESADIDHMPQGTLTFTINPYPASLDGRKVVRTEYLPLRLKFSSTGTKFKLPKAGRVTYRKGVLSVTPGGEENPSGLKLSYSAKNGTFKGSFNIYVLEGGKLTKIPAKITGVTALGYGFGDVTLASRRFKFSSKAYLFQ